MARGSENSTSTVIRDLVRAGPYVRFREAFVSGDNRPTTVVYQKGIDILNSFEGKQMDPLDAQLNAGTLSKKQYIPQSDEIRTANSEAWGEFQTYMKSVINGGAKAAVEDPKFLQNKVWKKVVQQEPNAPEFLAAVKGLPTAMKKDAGSKPRP